MIPNEDDVLAIKNFKKTVAGELKRRFTPSSNDITKSIPVLCAAVDPRYCQLKFLNTDQQALVHDELENVMELEDLEDSNSTIDLEAPEPPTKKSKQDSAMHFLLGTLSDETQSTNTGYDEIQKLVKEPTLDPDSNVLNWWQKNQERFPKLAQLARKFICTFRKGLSTSGNIVTKLRSSLKPENVDMLVFLNQKTLIC